MNQFAITSTSSAITLNQRERQFLQLACTELTYAQIAERMCLSPRTIDGYREALFVRLQLKSRVGLVMWAIKGGFVIL
ncbi:response regulator transcription factor [Spirosoma sp. KNUC1025]|uniref:response regulator transcription factor n=1 Tax=Spirosoma sp. KNUC1025 TaxID=2894082 RepID=UPI00386E2F15|nr:helix-turn-helix transcriptional regulator [Spirosoma sp. KNUC1025]